MALWCWMPLLCVSFLSSNDWVYHHYRPHTYHIPFAICRLLAPDEPFAGCDDLYAPTSHENDEQNLQMSWRGVTQCSDVLCAVHCRWSPCKLHPNYLNRLSIQTWPGHLPFYLSRYRWDHLNSSVLINAELCIAWILIMCKTTRSFSHTQHTCIVAMAVHNCT